MSGRGVLIWLVGKWVRRINIMMPLIGHKLCKSDRCSNGLEAGPPRFFFFLFFQVLRLYATLWDDRLGSLRTQFNLVFTPYPTISALSCRCE